MYNASPVVPVHTRLFPLSRAQCTTGSLFPTCVYGFAYIVVVSRWWWSSLLCSCCCSVVVSCLRAPLRPRVCHVVANYMYINTAFTRRVAHTSRRPFLKLKYATQAAMGPRGPYVYNHGSILKSRSARSSPRVAISPCYIATFVAASRTHVARAHIPEVVTAIYSMSAVPNDARWMDVVPAPSLELRRAVFFSLFFFSRFMRDITICVCFALSPRSASLTPRLPSLRRSSRFFSLVVFLFTEMHTHKEVEKGTFLAYGRK